MAQEKARVLIVGTGGIGAMSVYALDQGGKTEATAVLRSNYDVVAKSGFEIDSIQYGRISGYRPANIRKTVPDVAKEGLRPFDFILVTTKNLLDIPPSVADIIAPAVTPSKTAIILSQNGLNIEVPVIQRFPSNPVISSVTYLGATQKPPGYILHDDPDIQKIGPFPGQKVPIQEAEEAARRYIAVYDPLKRLELTYDPDVLKARWRKLIYNASYNSVASVLLMDTPRMRMSKHIIDDLIRPIMLEVIAAAEACGVTGFPPDLPETVIRGDPTDTGFKPSMCQDAERGSFMEIESIVGEPLREGKKRGVPMPTLRTIYGLLKGLQLKVKEREGLWETGFGEGHPYN
ncbi:ketopantoate reductase family protein [Aspergillus undulatus]|uniref:ketopantoate reductase family protein n=1 Tax=Aspergillus undulatus TaxID=1810928 RepID=UPI003CCCB854